MAFWDTTTMGWPERGVSFGPVVSPATRRMVDSGPSRPRVHKKHSSYDYTFKFYMTDAQHDAFWDFYRDEIDQGSVGIWVPVDKTGTAQEISTAGFIKGTPQSEPLDGWWIVDFNMLGERPFVSYMSYNLVIAGRADTTAPDTIDATLGATDEIHPPALSDLP